MGDRYGHRCGRWQYLPYRFGHLGYRYGIGANDMGNKSIDTVISRIDMRYLVTLPAWRGATVLDDILDPGTSPRSLS
jgi:hypothetical protein